MERKVFDIAKPLIGVLQLLPLPGSVGWKGRIHEVIARAEQEATAMATGGVDAILVENTGDAPYTRDRMDPAGAIAMGLIIRRIMHFTHIPIGVNVLRNDPETALAIAMNVGARFIRVPLLTGAALADEGILEGKFAELATYRKKLMAEGISVFADVSLEKTLPLAADTHGASLVSIARQALQAGGADGVILTDTRLTPADVQELVQTIDAPVYMDYMLTIEKMSPYMQVADGIILSSGLKKSPVASHDMKPIIDLTKVEEAVAIAEMIRPQPAPTH